MEDLKTMHTIYGEVAYSDNLGNDTLWIHKSVEHARVVYVCVWESSGEDLSGLGS